MHIRGEKRKRRRAEGGKKTKKQKKTSRVGLEPTTFELEVQCANPLRHRDVLAMVTPKSLLNLLTFVQGPRGVAGLRASMRMLNIPCMHALHAASAISIRDSQSPTLQGDFTS